MNRQPSWVAQQPPYYSSKMLSPRTTGRIILKITLYFVGAIIAEFFLLGTTLEATGTRSPINCATASVGIVALIGSIYLFFSREYYIHCLSRRQYLWWLLGASSVLFLSIVVIFVITNPNNNPIASAIVAGFFALYGISCMWIAHLKPSLPQQINESVYRIVKAMPGEQIGVADLHARLQKKYKHLNVPWPHYLEQLEYVELVNIPGAPGVICRMNQKPIVTVPPKTPAPVHIAHPQVAPIPLPPPIPAKQFAPLRPVQATSPSHGKPKEMSASFADQKAAPAIPIAAPKQASPLPSVPNRTPPHAKPSDVLTPQPAQQIAPAPSLPDTPKPPTSLSKEQQSLKIFCCYAHEDEHLLNKLKLHLKPQQRQGLVQIWHDRDISAGAEWEQEIEEQLRTAQIILLLVSPDFIASDYCYTKEMQRALDRHVRGEVRAVPIILRPVDWQITPLGKLQALPKDGKPITNWTNRDNAYLDVAKGIRALVETFLTPPQQPKKQIQASSNTQQTEAEVELLRARCKQGKLIVTNKKIAIELHGFGQTIKSQTLLRSSLSSIDSKLAVAPL
ncbi:MAG TPA: TIR domain-containing protein, partial [Ktedonobacteraceae bacterium]|nr:TIR domain-containing protein [Ktedonobacteraceae bacterium]